MADQVEELLSMGSWRGLLSIQEPAIPMLTLEVLALFEFDRPYNTFSNINTIQFRVFSEYYSMSVTQFSIRLGLYDEAYNDTEENDQLPTYYPGSVTP